MTGRPFIDTNVLVYAFDHTAPDRRERVLGLLRQDFVISAQVLSELYVTLTRKLVPPVAPADAATIVAELAHQDVVPVTTTLVQSAVATARTAQLSYWDALIVEAAVAAGCTTLLSEDLNPGQVITGVRIENPFR